MSRPTYNLGPRNPNWRGGVSDGHLKRLYPFDPDDPYECERCPAAAEIRHHKDGDRTNNAPSNIEFLCRPCHSREHAADRRATRPDDRRLKANKSLVQG